MEDEEFSEFETGIKQFNKWVAQQCFPVKVALTTFASSVAGAITGAYLDLVFEAQCSAISFQTPSKGLQLDPQKLSRWGGYRPLIQSFAAGSTREQARNFAVMFAAKAGLSCVMEKLRGKLDVESSMAVGFGTGVMLSLVTGMRGAEVMSVGVMFALLNGGLCKFEEKLAQENVEDVSRDKPTDMFSSIGLGLDHYKMNFNTGLFAHNTLSLLDRKKTKKGGRRTWLRSSGSNITRG